MKKSILALLALLAVSVLLVCSVSAAEVPHVEGRPLLYDEAGLLSPADAASVEAILKSISAQYGVDVGVMTFETMYGYYDIEAFADDFYDQNGYGTGDRSGGILLIQVTADRDWAVTAAGSCNRTFTDYGRDNYLVENFLPYLRQDDYSGAYKEFANSCAALLQYEKDNGAPYDYDSDKEPVKPFSLTRLLGSVVAGLLGGLVPVSSMKSKLKSVRSQPNARSYARDDTVQVTQANDFFIGRHVSRTPRETERSSGGGTTTHMSSGGVSHSGSHGKY